MIYNGTKESFYVFFTLLLSKILTGELLTGELLSFCSRSG